LHNSIGGIAYAVPAFLIWGLSPVYWKVLKTVPSSEILMHRIVWSFLFLIPLIIFQKQWGAFMTALKDWRILLILLATTLIIGCNWFLFIWAINHDHILQTSLGYYINPLVNVFLGMIFLKERLRRFQLVALLLAATGVLCLTFRVGEFPWVSLFLAFSFGFYGLIRKVAPVTPLVGLSVETMLLSLPALVYLFCLNHMGTGALFCMNAQTDLFLMGSSLVTGLPLLLFTAGTKRLHFSTVGFLQYIAPSCTFLLAIFIYKETLAQAQLLAFALVWTALLIYSADAISWYKTRTA